MMKILCLGDSLTYGYGISRREVWTHLAAKQGEIEMINAACNGNTTGGMLAIFQSEVEKYHPDRVFLMGGVNNILFSGTDAGARADIGALAHLCFAAGSHPIIGIPFSMCPPIREDWGQLADISMARQISDNYAAWLRIFSSTFHISSIDFRYLLPQQAIHWEEDITTWYLDGIHLNTRGQQAMAEIFVAGLR